MCTNQGTHSVSCTVVQVSTMTELSSVRDRIVFPHGWAIINLLSSNPHITPCKLIHIVDKLSSDCVVCNFLLLHFSGTVSSILPSMGTPPRLIGGFYSYHFCCCSTMVFLLLTVSFQMLLLLLLLLITYQAGLYLENIDVSFARCTFLDCV